MEQFITLVIENVFEVIAAALSLVIGLIFVPWLQKTGIPWLKEKRLFSVVYSFVKAAEKLAGSGALAKADKKGYVISLLENKGIKITPEVDAIIEAAVQQLDIALNSGALLIGGALDTAADYEGDPDEGE